MVYLKTGSGLTCRWNLTRKRNPDSPQNHRIRRRQCLITQGGQYQTTIRALYPDFLSSCECEPSVYTRV